MSKEFRIFEVDKYGTQFFVCRHSTLESAQYWLRKVATPLDEGASYIIQDEKGETY